ncbi:hypothetical protein [Bradyrhizobium sp. Mp27]|uniref:hypothetical protein n=1 Tax=Bradyrhizobium sp. Mp27 TaxID=3042157 RepID=UPI00248C6BF6|nr:hypothetical protein [Bradyrhizobium sp. Mp27]MDI2076075.1 hypothetical protein [Bradyrhizobium sp. Mp27]
MEEHYIGVAKRNDPANYRSRQILEMISSKVCASNRNIRSDFDNKPLLLSRRRIDSGLSFLATMQGKLWYADVRLQVTITSVLVVIDSSASSILCRPSEAMINIVPSRRKSDRATEIDTPESSIRSLFRSG